MGINPFNITAGGGAGDQQTYINAALRGLTLGGWFYFAGAAAADEYLMARWGGGNQSYRLYRLAAGTLRGSVDGPAGVVNVTTAATVGATTWTWLVLRWDPSTSLDVFVNRVLTSNVALIPATIDSNPTLPFTVGADSVAANFFSGRASSLFVCSAALPDVIVNAAFDRSKAAYNVN